MQGEREREREKTTVTENFHCINAFECVTAINNISTGDVHVLRLNV